MENEAKYSHCCQNENIEGIAKEFANIEPDAYTEENIPENGTSIKAKKKIGRLFLSFLEFAKKHKTLLIRIAAVSGSLIVIICIMLAFFASKRAKAAFEYLEGKVFCVYDTYRLFENGRVAEEEHVIDDEPEKSRVEGSLDDYIYVYKVVTFLFNNRVSIYVSSDGKDWDFYHQARLEKSDLSGDYFLDTYWNETTKEKVIEKRNDILCEHNFDETVIRQATCEESGEIQKTCKNCGTVKTEYPSVAHNYQSGKCTVCGRSEPKHRVSLNADEWYRYTPLDGLIVKNALIESASETAGGAIAWINPVCAHCHCVIGNLAATNRLVSVSQLKKWSKSFLCYDCNRYTEVTLAFDFGY